MLSLTPAVAGDSIIAFTTSVEGCRNSLKIALPFSDLSSIPTNPMFGRKWVLINCRIGRYLIALRVAASALKKRFGLKNLPRGTDVTGQVFDAYLQRIDEATSVPLLRGHKDHARWITCWLLTKGCPCSKLRALRGYVWQHNLYRSNLFYQASQLIMPSLNEEYVKDHRLVMIREIARQLGFCQARFTPLADFIIRHQLDRIPALGDSLRGGESYSVRKIDYNLPYALVVREGLDGERIYDVQFTSKFLLPHLGLTYVKIIISKNEVNASRVDLVIAPAHTSTNIEAVIIPNPTCCDPTEDITDAAISRESTSCSLVEVEEDLGP